MYHLRKYEKSPYYYARITHDRTHKRGNWISTKQTAEREAIRVAKRWDAEAHGFVAADTVAKQEGATLQDAIDHLKKHLSRKRVTEDTREYVTTKVAWLLDYWGPTFPLSAFSLQQTEAYMDARRKSGTGDSTIAKELIYLKAALRRCHSLGLYAKLPDDLWPPALPKSFPARERWLTWEEFKKLEAELAPRTSFVRQQIYGNGRFREQRIEYEQPFTKDYRDHLAMYCFFGLRWKDLYELRVWHVRDDHLQIPGTKTAGSKRQVPIADYVKPILERRVREASGGVLFPHGQYEKQTWWRALRDACERAGIEHVCTLDLRRTFATWAWQGGVDEGQLVRWMGHTNSAMVRKVYAQPSRERGVREIAKMPGGSHTPAMTPLDQWGKPGVTSENDSEKTL